MEVQAIAVDRGYFDDVETAQKEIQTTLRNVSQRRLQLRTWECYILRFMLDQYHYTSGIPLEVTPHLSIQLYPIGPKSLELAHQSPCSANVLFSKITLQFANKQPDRILQALLIRSGIDPYEVGRYRSTDDEDGDEDDDSDYEKVDNEQKDEYIGWQECWKVSGDVAVKAVDLGAWEDVIEDEGNDHYEIMHDVTEWKCFGYAEGKEDPGFEADALLAMSTQSSPSRSTASDRASGSGNSDLTTSSQSTTASSRADDSKAPNGL
ncbi:hypothetical protein DL95DRAFT_418534 [Leptodontidium sp. 2 PMI_412]|nr:hypothetical protein DL95DRAFT_418534 [Leptodontidium sp. 2 PMI_412]